MEVKDSWSSAKSKRHVEKIMVDSKNVGHIMAYVHGVLCSPGEPVTDRRGRTLVVGLPRCAFGPGAASSAKGRRVV